MYSLICLIAFGINVFSRFMILVTEGRMIVDEEYNNIFKRENYIINRLEIEVKRIHQKIEMQKLRKNFKTRNGNKRAKVKK